MINFIKKAWRDEINEANMLLLWLVIYFISIHFCNGNDFEKNKYVIVFFITLLPIAIFVYRALYKIKSTSLLLNSIFYISMATYVGEIRVLLNFWEKQNEN